MILDFTTTACIRPVLLNKTYESYSRNLEGVNFKECTLHINIDNVGNGTNVEPVLNVAKKYFGEVKFNTPKQPNFAVAAKWCLSQPITEYFFHLEDDWQLLREVSIESMLKLFKKNTLQVVLNKSRLKTRLSETGEPMFVPSLIKTKHMKFYTESMGTTTNPEAQLKYKFRSTPGSPNSVFYDITKEYSRDLGKSWLNKMGFKRDMGGKPWAPWITYKKNDT